MRTQWLKENKRLVAQDNFGNDLTAVEAAMKKHEAIESDIHVSPCKYCGVVRSTVSRMPSPRPVCYS